MRPPGIRKTEAILIAVRLASQTLRRVPLAISVTCLTGFYASIYGNSRTGSPDSVRCRRPNGFLPRCGGSASQTEFHSFGTANHHAAGSPVVAIDRVRERAVFGGAWEQLDSWQCDRALNELRSLFGW